MFYLVKHVNEEGPGLFRPLMPAETMILDATENRFPQTGRNDCVLIMGGPMGVYEKKTYPFIEGELDFIRRCNDAGTKVWGVCLGAQMIAEALGGSVYKGAVREVGWYTVKHTADALQDPVFGVFPEEMQVFQWHQDTFTLPPNAIVLASSDNYPNQAFKAGDRIYGLQYHIEADDGVLSTWFAGAEADRYCVREYIDPLRLYATQAFRRFLAL